MNIAFVGGFGMAPKRTLPSRALPLAQQLVAQGHTVTLLAPPWDHPADSGRRWSDGGVPVVNLPLPPRLPLAWYPWLGLRLLRATMALNPDVVHVFKPKGFSAFVAQALLAGQAAGRHRNLRVVVDTDDWEGAGGWNDIEPYPAWQKTLFAHQEQWLLRHAPAVTCASRELLRMAQAVRGTVTGLHYLPNGAAPWPAADPAAVAALRTRLQLDPARPVLLLYTRFVECPPARFARLLAEIAALGCAPTVLQVGTGIHGQEAELRQALAASGVALPLVQAGWVDAADLPAYLALADAALFPMEDTVINRTKCSVKLVDLLSAGVPVAAEAVGQSAEYIDASAGGLLTPPGDEQALANATVRLLTDAALAHRLGARAAERMQTAFAWPQVAAALAGAYAG